MENTSYIGLSRQMALSRKLDIIANNVSNLNTAGYQGERAIFEEFLVESTNKREVSYVQDMGIWRDNARGPQVKTGSPFDLTTSENTFFVVGTDDGPRFTTNGRFQLSADGTLVNLNGLPVLDSNDEPIVITEADGQINVTQAGLVTGDIGDIAELRIVTFNDLQRLWKAGGGLYNTGDAPIELTGTQDRDEIRVDIELEVNQGVFTVSNVQGIKEMTRMMDVVRAYTSTANMLKTNHDLQRTSVEKLGKVVTG